MCVVLCKRKMVRTCIFFLYNKRQKMEHKYWHSCFYWPDEHSRCLSSMAILEFAFKENSKHARTVWQIECCRRASWSTCSFAVLISCADNIWISRLVTDWANLHMPNQKATWCVPTHRFTSQRGAQHSSLSAVHTQRDYELVRGGGLV